MGPMVRRALVPRRVLLLVVTAMLAAVLPLPAAEAQTISSSSTGRVLGDLQVERHEIQMADGRRVRSDVLRLPRDAPELELRPRLARNTAVSLQPMAAFSAAELARGAVVGINGGYWLSRPTGVPNGLYIERDRMVGADSSLRSGLPAGRAVAGIRQDGTLVADRIRVALTLDVPLAGIVDVAIDELNRQVRTDGDRTHASSGELLLFDGRYGTSIEVRAGSTLLVLDDLPLRSSGTLTAIVRERRAPTTDSRWTVPEGTSALLAYGTSKPLLDGIPEGTQVQITTRVEPFGGGAEAWQDLRSSVPGAGLLIRDGRISSGTAMSSEGVDHASNRRARTAIGQTTDGTTLLVTVDERGGSTGVTLFEFAQVMQRFGAVNAVAMDGGGSTHMTIDGRTHNQPSDPNRGQSSAWFVYAPTPPPSRDILGACPDGGAPSGSFDDTTATVHAGAIDCLSWWGVTSGITLTSYAPADGVTRDQMASFLARWIDGVADRGDGRPLLADASLPFDDVRAGNVHATAIARLSAAGIIQGRSATIYDPGAPVTRAETATLLRRSTEYVQDAPLPVGRDTFTDDNASVHEDSIDRLSNLGIVGGTGGFTYRPNDPVSRAAMASMVMRSSDWLVEEGRTTPP